MVQAHIEVRVRQTPQMTFTVDSRTGRSKPNRAEYRRAMNELHKPTIVYFFHDHESVLENFGNRVARPTDVYKQFLPQVAEKLGQPGATFRWSQKAGCACGCSPGFICGPNAGEPKWNIASLGKDVYVRLSPDVTSMSDNPRQQEQAASRRRQLQNDPTMPNMESPSQDVDLNDLRSRLEDQFPDEDSPGFTNEGGIKRIHPPKLKSLWRFGN